MPGATVGDNQNKNNLIPKVLIDWAKSCAKKRSNQLQKNRCILSNCVGKYIHVRKMLIQKISRKQEQTHNFLFCAHRKAEKHSQM